VRHILKFVGSKLYLIFSDLKDKRSMRNVDCIVIEYFLSTIIMVEMQQPDSQSAYTRTI